jgi:hypothetical protein
MKENILENILKNYNLNEEFPDYYSIILYESGGDFLTYSKILGYDSYGDFLNDFESIKQIKK